jgi:hypothetical protein
MSTKGYLKGLDYDQLLYARNCADELIKAKDAETRVPIWVVSGDCRNVGGFLECDYLKAVERAHQLIDEEAKSGRGFVIQVEQERRRENEVPDILAWCI